MLSSLIFIVAFLRSYVAVTVDPTTSAAGISVSLINDPRGLNQVDGNNRWKLENSASDPLNNWGLQINLDAETYGFKSGASDSSVTVSVDADIETGEADLFVGVGIGDQYVTYAFDLDGGLWLQSNAEANKGGVWTFPQCSTGTMAHGDVSGLLLAENLAPLIDAGIGFQNALRDALCGGDDNDAELLTTTRNYGALPVTLQLTSNDVAKTLEITFSTPTYASAPFSCTFDVTGASVVGQDIDIFLNNHADSVTEIVQIKSVDVAAANVGNPIDVFNPMYSMDWESLPLRENINPAYFDPSNAYDGASGLGFDSVGFEVRTYDGRGNNLDNPEFGAAQSQAVRCVPPAYSDGIGELAGPNRRNPREISNVVCKQEPEDSPDFVNDRMLTQFAWQWGQFIDHDVTLISEATSAEIGVLSAEHVNVYVPCNDPAYDADLGEAEWCDAEREIEIFRTHVRDGTGTSESNPRQQENEITAFVDASNIYGSDAVRAARIRSGENGKLLLEGDANFGDLPANGVNGYEENEPNMDEEYRVAGDVRPNEQLGLLTMHTIWARFHNLMADGVKEAVCASAQYFEGNCDAAEQVERLDEIVYQFTKLIVTAIEQKITFQDWLPTLFGEPTIARFMGDYGGYNSATNAGTCLIFSSAAYRLGHTFLPNFLPLRDENCEFVHFDDCDVCDDSIGGIRLRDSFFVPQIAAGNEGFFEALLYGYSCTLANEVDVHITEGVRNFLFESAFSPPTSTADDDRIFGDLDLIAINLQRGREHGLPDYNTVRYAMGLSRLSDFEQISGDSELVEKLRVMYKDDINDIDLFIGVLAEDHLAESSFGETISAIVLGQFGRFRDGDRFWYQNYLQPGELLQFVNSVTLKSVIEITTGIENLHTLDSVRHSVFQNSRAVPLFSGESFDTDVFFAHGDSHSHVIHKKHPHPPQSPVHAWNASDAYVIAVSKTQLLLFLAVLAVIGCILVVFYQFKSKRNTYRPVKFDVDTEMDASDREQLQS